MAAAIIPLVTAAVSAIGPQIPSIVTAVENLFGHSSKTGQQTGTQKMDAAVSALQSLLTSLANAGKIPSAPVVDPSLIPGLTGAVQSVVDALKAQGALGGTESAPASPSTPAPPAAQPASEKWTISGTLVRS